MLAQATSWTVPTLYYAAPSFGVCLMFVLFVLGLPRMIALSPRWFRESVAFQGFCVGLFVGGCLCAGFYLAQGLTKLATG